MRAVSWSERGEGRGGEREGEQGIQTHACACKYFSSHALGQKVTAVPDMLAPHRVPST